MANQINSFQQDSSSSYNFLFKYILLGDMSKSSLLHFFLNNKFRQSYQSTLGVQFGTRTFTRQGLIIKAMIWDTAGQQSFRSIIRSYYRSAIIAVLVFDCTSAPSFESIPRWLDEIEQHGNPLIKIVLVSNKTDLKQKKVISQDQVQNLIHGRNIFFYEASAKNGVNVDQIFVSVTDSLIQQIEDKTIVIGTQDVGIKIGNNQVNPLSEGVQITVNKCRDQKKCKC